MAGFSDWHQQRTELPVSRTSGQIVGVSRIIDGDTLDISSTHIRLEGIDAPKTGQICKLDGRAVWCGKDATRHLSNRIRRSAISR